MSYDSETHKFILPDDLYSWPPENDNFGHIEYKRHLSGIDSNIDKVNKIITQMHWRMLQGLDLYDKYESFYVIGVDDNGKFSGTNETDIKSSINIIEFACKQINSYIYSLSIIDLHKKGQIAVIHIKGNKEKIKEYKPY